MSGLNQFGNYEQFCKALETWWSDKIVGRAWNMSCLTYSEGDSITVLPNCFAIMITNVGGDPATLNGMRLFPNTNPATGLGDSRSISGHWLDMYMGNLNLAFAGTGPNPLVEIVQLFYHNQPLPLSTL